MKKVSKHRYALPKGATLFDSVDGVKICELEGGSWLGIMSESNDWYHVNTAQLDGWVKISETVNAKPYTLSAKVNGLIQNYILL